MKYTKGKDKYIEIGRDQKPVYKRRRYDGFFPVSGMPATTRAMLLFTRIIWAWQKEKSLALEMISVFFFPVPGIVDVWALFSMELRR